MYCVAIINIRGMKLPNYVYFIPFPHLKAILFFIERKLTINEGVLCVLWCHWVYSTPMPVGNRTDCPRRLIL